MLVSCEYEYVIKFQKFSSFVRNWSFNVVTLECEVSRILFVIDFSNEYSTYFNNLGLLNMNMKSDFKILYRSREI